MELLAPFVDPGSRTAWFALLAFVVVGGGWHRWHHGSFGGVLHTLVPKGVWAHRSTHLDIQLLLARQLLGILGFGVAAGGSVLLARRVVFFLDGHVGRPDVPVAVVVALFPVVLFLAWDLSRYVVHRLMHQVPLLWSFHQVHHSAELMTPLTFHRVHPVESLMYQLRGVLVTGTLTGVGFWLARADATDWTLLGVNGAGLLFNVATGNLRHSHVWLRFPASVERWLISPAQHQLHHGIGTDHVNYGTWIAVWDRLGGSWAPAPVEPPAAFGLSERNHGDDLLSAWFGPFLEVLRRGRAPAAALGLLLWGADARGQEDSTDDEGREDESSVEIVVMGDDRTPRVAGSAHVLDEEDLELFAQDDIHQVLARVPGVYVRQEDGFGLRPNIGIRGASSERSSKLTLLEDGVPVAPAPYAAPAAYYFPMVTRMAAVEVFKGPAAVQTGPQTVGGAINMVTRSVPRDGTVASVDLAAGLRNTGRVHAYVGHGDERSGVLGEFTMLTTTGFKELDGGGPTGFRRGEGMVKARVASDPALRVQHALEVKVGYAGELSNETYLGLSVTDLDTPYRRYASTALDQMGWHRTQLEVSWPVRLGPDLKIRTTAYHHELDRAWVKVNRFAQGPDLHDLLLLDDPSGQAAVFLDILRGEEDSQSSDQRIQLGTNDRLLVNYGVQSTASWHVDLSGARGPRVEHRLKAGLRVHADRVQRLHTEAPHDMVGGSLVPVDGADTVVLLDAETRADAVAAFLHEDFTIGRVSLLPGLRVETVRTQRIDAGVEPEDAITRVTPLPGMGALVEVVPRVQLFGGVYRGFSPVAPGQPDDVRPESSWNYEGGTRLGSGIGPHAELVYFQNEYTNLVGQCTISGGCLGDSVDDQFNGGSVRLLGLEAVAGTTLLLPAQMSIPLEGTYTYTRGIFLTSFDSSFPQFGEVESGDGLPYVPDHQGSLIGSLEGPRWRLGVELAGRSGMRDAAGPVDEEPLVPSLLTLGAAAHVQVLPAWQIYATGSNLTGRSSTVSWRPFGARPVAPLQVMLGASWTPAG